MTVYDVIWMDARYGPNGDMPWLVERSTNLDRARIHRLIHRSEAFAQVSRELAQALTQQQDAGSDYDTYVRDEITRSTKIPHKRTWDVTGGPPVERKLHRRNASGVGAKLTGKLNCSATFKGIKLSGTCYPTNYTDLDPKHLDWINDCDTFTGTLHLGDFLVATVAAKTGATGSIRDAAAIQLLASGTSNPLNSVHFDEACQRPAMLHSRSAPFSLQFQVHADHRTSIQNVKKGGRFIKGRLKLTYLLKYHREGPTQSCTTVQQVTTDSDRHGAITQAWTVRETHRYHKFSEPPIRNLPFQRLVRAIAQNFKTNFQFQIWAASALRNAGSRLNAQAVNQFSNGRR
ncbi:histone H3.2 [Clonorchis sinensis]|uniref:Histone H3.2 n=1 Tax=Clonorchis sinensis TaxID=79923 RepID=G7YMT7_CLOSI|nr:histone H3.2 [Clonorchis sinensis]